MITRGATSKELYPLSDADSHPVSTYGTSANFPVFNGPSSVVFDSAGNLYVSDTINRVIRKIAPNGSMTNFAGNLGVSGSSDGTGSNALLGTPLGLAIDSSENLYVADYTNHTIRKITAAGVVTTLAGTAGQSGMANGTGAAARFNYPSSVAVDSGGNVYVADNTNNQIRKITSGGIVTLLAGSSTGAAGTTNGTGTNAKFSLPRGVAVDGSGNIYVADSTNNMIRKITSTGVVSTLAGAPNTSGSTDGAGTNARFDFPCSIAVDSSSNLFVVDQANNTIRKITSAGMVTTLAGSAPNSGSVDGTGSAARFKGPAGVGLDGSGNIFVADKSNNLVRKITSTGVVTTLFGTTAILSIDRFFLDGNRLETVAGDSGADLSEYRTSLETFSRIIYHNDGATADWFEIWTKDGLRMELGKTSDGRAEAMASPSDPPRAGAWLLNHVQDLSGNYLDVTYTVNDDSLAHFPYPKEIKYTGNGTVTPANSVKFTYELRPDKDKLHLNQNGIYGSVDIVHRLKTVGALAAGTTVRTYTLNYDNSSFTQRSRLTDLQESGINGTTLPKTSFTWNTDANGFTSPATGTLSNSGDLLYAGDFNGDGKTDILLIGSTSNRTTQLYLSTGTGLLTTSAPAAFDLNPVTNYLDTTSAHGNDRLLVGDINGDGLPDIVATLVSYSLVDSTHVKMTVRRKVWLASVSGGAVSFSNPATIDISPPNFPFSGTFAVPPAPLERLMDLDGSGKASLFSAQSGYFSPSNIWAVYKWNSSTNTFDSQTGGTNGFRAEDDIRPIDADGDGVADLWLPVYDSSGGRIVVSYVPKSTTPLSLTPTNSNIVLGDFNGDRLTDALDLPRTGGTGIFRSAYKSFNTIGSNISSVVTDWNAQVVTAVDMNRDGRDDLIIQRGARCDLCYAQGDASNPVAFTSAITIPSGPLSNETVMPIDFNGDGRTDLLVRGSTSYKILVASGTSPGDVITRVTNGFGATVDVGYASLTDSSVYTKGSSTPAGLIDLQTPLPVVKTVTYDLGAADSSAPSSGTVPASTAVSYTQTYKYEALRSAPYRGVVGFGAQEVTDSRTNVTTRVERKQDANTANYALNGFVTRTTVKRGSVILADSQTTPAVLSLNGGKTSLAYAQTVTAKTWDISTDLASQGTMTSNQTVTQTLDSWGNATSVVTSFLNAAGNTVNRKITQNTSYRTPDTSTGNWLVSRVDTSSTVFEVGTTSVTRDTQYYYRDNDGDATSNAQGSPLLVTKSVAFPNDAAKKLTSVYSYTDGFGHVNSLAVTGLKDDSTSQTRTVAYAYDASGAFLTIVTHTGPNGDLVDTYVPDAVHGAPASHSDANNQTTTFVYDDFCRLVSTTSPANVTTTTSLAWQTDTRGLYSVETHSTFADIDGLTKETAPPSFTVFDRIGRVVRQESLTADGTAVTKADTLYNSIGAPWATAVTYRASDPIYWNQVSYDALGRSQTQTNANGGATSIVYNGPETTTTVTGDYNSATITKKVRTVCDLQGRVTDVFKNEGLGATAERDSVNYQYDAAGNLAQTTAAGVVTSTVNDARGLPTSLTDPNAGTRSTVYNAFGEAYSTTDAKTQTVSFDFDILGRPVTRTEAEGTTSWTYDLASGKGLGLLSSVSAPDGGGGTYSESYFYDSTLSRLASVSKTITGRTCSTTMGYDGASRVASVTYQVPSFASQSFGYQYNSFGALSQVRDMSVPGVLGDPNVPGGPFQGPVQSQTLWTLGSVSVFGQPVTETLGNGVSSLNHYRETDGMMDSRKVSTPFAGTYLENLKLGLDPFGNVHRRELYNDSSQSSLVRAEDYGIDLLDRLTSVKLNNTTSLTVSYDAQGNITYKSDVGNYTYSGIDARPHAVTQAGSTTYSYDANGNLLNRNNATVNENVWTSFDQPLTIVRNGVTSTFRYGADRQRIQQVTGETGGATADQVTTRYFGGGMEHVVNGRATTCRYAVFAPGGRVAQIAVTSSYGETTRTTSYFASDHLGSVEAVTDEQGNVIEQLSYDAWGQRRNVDWTAGTPGYSYSNNVTRGYTDHEMLDGVGLIHMNGRVYDPTLGRFLSADPNIDGVSDAQGYNRYSYVGNNPLGATDPTGFFKLKEILGAIIAIVVTAVCIVWFGPSGVYAAKGFWAAFVQGIGQSYAIGAAAVGGFAGGFSGSLLNGGSLGDAFKSGLIGAATGAATAWVAGVIGDKFGPIGSKGPWNEFERAIAHGAAGGAITEASGGEFRHGFYAGFAGSAAGSVAPSLGLSNIGERTAFAAVVGGTASALGGGKFANGAITAAFQHLFNQEAHDGEKDTRSTWQKFKDGVWAGTGFGEDAAQYYAAITLDENASWYAKGGAYVGGTVSSLWMRDTYIGTATTLIPTGGAILTVEQTAARRIGVEVSKNNFIKDKLIRWGYDGRLSRALHFHLAPAMEHHLPAQIRPWYYHSKAIISSWFK